MEASALTHASRGGLLGRRSPLLKLQGDERLVALIREGNEHAFEVLVDRYHSRLLAFCRHMLRSTEDAEDVLQEVFVKSHAAMLADERPINARPWLYRIARNRCLNHLRSPVPEGQDSMDVMPADGGVTTADRVQKREDFRALIVDVGDLPETQRTALLLREIDALSYEEIAAAMDTTIPAVKSLLVRARMSLAEASQSRQLTCGEVQLELAEATEGLRKASGPVRHHVKRCEACGEFRAELRQNSKALAALAPLGPLAVFHQAIIGKLSALFGGSSAGGATGTAAGGGAVAGTAAGAGAAVGGGTAAAGAAAGAAGGGVTLGGAAAAGAGGHRRRARRQGRGDRRDRRDPHRGRGRGPPDLQRHSGRHEPEAGRRRTTPPATHTKVAEPSAKPAVTLEASAATPAKPAATATARARRRGRARRRAARQRRPDRGRRAARRGSGGADPRARSTHVTATPANSLDPARQRRPRPRPTAAPRAAPR